MAIKINRETIITSMCFTYRHDYGLDRPQEFDGMFGCGMNDDERKALWNQMAQIFDNDIAPVMEIKKEYADQNQIISHRQEVS